MLIALAVGLCGVAAGKAPAATQIFVAPKGDNANPGTRERPLATVAGARDAVRVLKRKGLKAPIEVVLQAGTYQLEKPVVFEPQDSGTADFPITYRAANGAKVVLSGGKPITGWRKREGNVWAAPVLRALAPRGMDFRLLRVGDRLATRARTPNADPTHPTTGGWAFAVFGGEPWERGQFGVAVQNNHNIGDRMTWNIRVPGDGTYRVWARYAHKMTDYGVADMAGHGAMQVDGGALVPLMNLPDTGGWDKWKWSYTADLQLTAGKHELAWVNVKGGGTSFDAFALTDDEDWDPQKAIGAIEWWGGFKMTPPAEDKHVLIIQSEACDSATGPEIQVPKTTPPGTFKSMRYKPGALSKIADASEAEVHIFIAWGWVNAIVPVASIDNEKHEIVFAGDGAAQDVRPGNRFFIENVREALDAPGEWFLDKAKGEVLYIPDSAEFPKQTVVAPMLDRLIVLKGDGAAGDFVEHLSFEGLTFADTTYTLTTDYYTPQDATILMSGARDCAVRRCEFGWNGGYALKLTDRSERCVFARNHVHHMGQGGVVTIGGTKEAPHHCSVLGNTMEFLGLIYKHVAGVYICHGSDNRIAYNRITDVPRYAISFKSQGEDNLAQRNVAEYNDLRRTNLETNDTGAIESLGYEHRDSGNVIRYNLILDSVGMATSPEGEILTPYFTWGIYMDDFSSGTTIYGNIVTRNVVGGVCIHGGQNNQIENNIFVDGSEQEVRLQPNDDFMKGNTFVRNIVAYSNPGATLVYSYNQRRDMFTQWDYNLYWLRGGDLSTLAAKNTPEGTWADWLKAGFDAHSRVADPLFVDAAKDDYRLRPDSPAFALGFKAIPAEKIGPQGMTEE
jgi:parallel beta-helix repeat protein